jgi:hypothetical protein
MLFQLIPFWTINKLIKVSHAQKLWKQKVLKIHKNQDKLWQRLGLNLNSNTKHENENKNTKYEK